MFMPRLRILSNRITFIQEDRLPSLLNGDDNRLKQILINLTNSGLKFSIKKHIRIKANYDHKEHMLRVSLDVDDVTRDIDVKHLIQ